MEEKVLYESKGCSAGITAFYIILGIIVLALGIMFFCLSGARYEVETVTPYLITDGGKMEPLANSSFSMGGGYKFTEETRNFFKVFGFVGIATFVMGIINVFTLRRLWVKIYENHIEGKAWGGLMADKQFFCTTIDIQSYEIINGLPFPIVINTPSGKYKVISKDRKKACAALQTIIKNK